MRLLEAQGLAGIWLTFILYGTALVASLPRTYRALPEFAQHPRDLLLLMLAAGWTNIAFVEAVLRGNILRVLLLFYLAPLWQVFLGWLVLGERPSRSAIASLLLAMAGAIVMLWDPQIGLPAPSGHADWYALSAGLAFAASNVITRKVRSSLAAKAISVWSGVTLLALVLAPAFTTSIPSIGLGVFLGSVVLGLGGIMLMTLLVQYGVTHMPIYRSAVIALVELVAGAISQQLLTNEVVTAKEWVGGVLIVAGAYLSARSSQHARHKKAG